MLIFNTVNDGTPRGAGVTAPAPATAYRQARSGIALSGVTYTGWTPYSITITIAGVDQTTLILKNGQCVITDRAGQPSTFTFSVRGFAPIEGQDVKVLYATPDEFMFGGTLLQIEAQALTPFSDGLIYHCTAVGYHWLIDRYDLVTNRYRQAATNFLVHSILNNWTDGGFQKGDVSEAFGLLNKDYVNDRVTDTLNEIGADVGAMVEITPSRYVNIHTAPAIATWDTLTESDILVGSLGYRRDLTQVRNRVRVSGRGSTVAVLVNAGATIIDVQDCEPFLTTGGTAVGGSNIITYTGTSVGSGPGQLLGVTGVLWEMSVGESITTEAMSVDLAAQTALAATLGGGLSGQATHAIDGGGISVTEAGTRGVADIDTFSTALPELTWTYATPRRHLRVGTVLTVAIASPVVIAGSYQIQVVSTTINDLNLKEMWQTVGASRFTRTQTDLLLKLRG